MAAQHLGPTWLPSLALSFTNGVGTATLSRNSLGADIPAIGTHRTIFERLFPPADRAQLREAQARLDLNRSVLDTAVGNVRDFQRQLGRADRQRLQQYLESIREVERRIKLIEARNSSGEERELPGAPAGVPDSFTEHVKLMYDLQALAFAGDITRVFSFKTGRDGSARVYPDSGVNLPFHPASRVTVSSPRTARSTAHSTMLGVGCSDWRCGSLRGMAQPRSGSVVTVAGSGGGVVPVRAGRGASARTWNRSVAPLSLRWAEMPMTPGVAVVVCVTASPPVVETSASAGTFSACQPSGVVTLAASGPVTNTRPPPART